MRSNEFLSLKEIIIQILARDSPLSLKKIYRIAGDKMGSNASYQGIHKSAKKMLSKGDLQKIEGEYCLSPKTIDHFLSTSRKIIKNENLEIRNNNYKKIKLSYKTLRLIPFYAGKISVDRHKNMEKISEDSEKIVFQYGKSFFVLFKKTGVYIQIYLENEQNDNIVDLLFKRRKEHLSILNFKSKSSEDISKLAKILLLDEEKIKDSISYTMALYYIKENKDIEENIETLIKLISIPSILGITDNPEENVTKKMLEDARRKLGFLDKEILSKNKPGVVVRDKEKIMMSWSNVVVYGDLRDIFDNKLIQMELELQHLWYLLYNITNNKTFPTKVQKELDVYIKERWEKFKKVDATTDILTLHMKEDLIKTSRIEKIYEMYNERQNKK